MRLTILLLTISTSTLVATHVVRPASVAAYAGAEGPASPAVEQPPQRSLVGTLDQVDSEATEFVVKTEKGKQTFVLQSGATIRQGSKTIKASDLATHKGERVKVRYREAEGVRRAEWIVVAAPSHKAKS